MSDMNSVNVTGRLGRDPEIKYTPSGKAVCEVGIAVDCGWGDRKSTCWLDVTFWEKAAETLCEHAKKGSKIGVTGELRQDTWEDKQSGQKRSKIAVTSRSFVFLGDKSNGDSRGEEPHTPSSEPATQSYPEEEIPF